MIGLLRKSQMNINFRQPYTTLPLLKLLKGIYKNITPQRQSRPQGKKAKTINLIIKNLRKFQTPVFTAILCNATSK
jgi:hypothetical protein